jgi:hypothetical protein
MGVSCHRGKTSALHLLLMTWYYASGYCILNGLDISHIYHYKHIYTRADLLPLPAPGDHLGPEGV